MCPPAYKDVNTSEQSRIDGPIKHVVERALVPQGLVRLSLAEFWCQRPCEDPVSGRRAHSIANNVTAIHMVENFSLKICLTKIPNGNLWSKATQNSWSRCGKFLLANDRP